jgi:hypothetical protein
MTTKPQVENILQGILHSENESKQNHERTGSIKPQEKKRQVIKTSIGLAQQNNCGGIYHIPININTEC